MKGISDIKIIGVDKARPPFIRKEPYIDIYFELSHQAPTDWCEDLNTRLTNNHTTKTSSINGKEGLFIKSWVRTPGEITSLLEQLKNEITECTSQYIERIQLNSPHLDGKTSGTSESSEQINLNNIITSLVFD